MIQCRKPLAAPFCHARRRPGVARHWPRCAVATSPRGQGRCVKESGVLPGLPHFAAKAKRVIFLCMAGGPSHLETFDYKPKLAELDGQPMPESFTKGQPIAQLQGKKLKCLGPLTKFQKYGQSGQVISDFLPWHAKMADDICIVRSMVTEQINHDPAHTFMNTGTAISGRPSMGSWVTYGLGSESEDLPGFVVLTSVGGRNPQPIASRQWSAGSCPAASRAWSSTPTGDPVHYVRNPRGRHARRSSGELVDAIDAAQPASQPSGRQPGDRHAHRRLRNGLSHADVGARTDGRLRRAAARPRHVRRQAGRRLVRLQLPAGPAAGRTRRAVHPALPPRLGPPRRIW